MQKLKVGGSCDANAPGARIGGNALVPAGTAWPTCKSCSGPMRFQFQVPLDALGLEGQHLACFMCEGNPGLCDEWAPNSGGNHAVVVKSAGAVSASFPGLKEGHRKNVPTKAIPAVSLVPTSGKGAVAVLGGEPEWIQADETPDCSCGQRMSFVVQVDQAANRDLNFGGGGVAYAFVCKGCGSGAKFLWQS